MINNLLCKVFGHIRVVRDFYPNDPIISICCRRCKQMLKVDNNPGYIGNNIFMEDIVCYKILKNSSLTIGKVYKIHYQRDGMYCVLNDNNKMQYYEIILYNKRI